MLKNSRSALWSSSMYFSDIMYDQRRLYKWAMFSNSIAIIGYFDITKLVYQIEPCSWFNVLRLQNQIFSIVRWGSLLSYYKFMFYSRPVQVEWSIFFIKLAEVSHCSSESVCITPLDRSLFLAIWEFMYVTLIFKKSDWFVTSQGYFQPENLLPFMLSF